jgi:hypothetical protein
LLRSSLETNNGMNVGELTDLYQVTYDFEWLQPKG